MPFPCACDMRSLEPAVLTCADFDSELSRVVATLYDAPRPVREVPADFSPEDVCLDPLPGTSSCGKGQIDDTSLRRSFPWT